MKPFAEWTNEDLLNAPDGLRNKYFEWLRTMEQLAKLDAKENEE